MKPTARADTASSSYPILLVLLLTAVATAPALWGGFLFDDVGLIPERARWLSSGRGWWELVTHPFWWGAPGEAAKQYLFRPWITTTYWVGWQIGGGSPLVFHLSNWLVHLANVTLLLLLLRPLLGRNRALAVAALFGVTPAAMTSVGWIAGRTDLWALCFTLLFLLAFRKAREAGKRAWLAAASVLFFLALSAKEIAIIAPLLAWLLERLEAPPQRDARSPWARYAVLLIPLLLFLVLRSSVVGSAVPARLSGAETGAMLPYVAEKVTRTAWHVLAPLQYSFFSEYRWSLPAQRGAMFFAGWLVLIALAVVIVLGLRRRQAWAAGGAWFGLVVLPVYLFGQSFAPMADFYAYAGIPGLWLFVTGGVEALLSRRAKRPVSMDSRPGRIGVTFIVLVFAALVFTRLPILRTERALAEHMVRQEPRSVMAMERLAEVLLASGQANEARQWLERAAQINPSAIGPRLQLARLYLGQGDVQGAAPHVDILAERGAQNLDAQGWIGHFYYLAGHCPEAVTTYERALRLGTPPPGMLFNYGLALLCVREDQKALEVYREVSRQLPDWALARHNLGICYENLGQLDQAASAYREAVRLDPTLGMSWESLALVALQQGKRGEAEQAARAYFELQPPAERADRLRAQLAAAKP